MSMIGANGSPFQGIFDCCIAGVDTDVQRRPYHKNCKCALHSMQRGNWAIRCNHVAYPIRRTWSDGCLSLMNTADGDGTLSPTRGVSPVTPGKITRTRTQLVLCKEEDEEYLDDEV